MNIIRAHFVGVFQWETEVAGSAWASGDAADDLATPAGPLPPLERADSQHEIRVDCTRCGWMNSFRVSILEDRYYRAWTNLLSSWMPLIWIRFFT